MRQLWRQSALTRLGATDYQVPLQISSHAAFEVPTDSQYNGMKLFAHLLLWHMRSNGTHTARSGPIKW
jgi:hypothetical protein